MPSPFRQEGEGSAATDVDSRLGLQVGGSHVGTSAISGLSSDPESILFETRQRQPHRGVVPLAAPHLVTPQAMAPTAGAVGKQPYHSHQSLHSLPTLVQHNTAVPPPFQQQQQQHQQQYPTGEFPVAAAGTLPVSIAANQPRQSRNHPPPSTPRQQPTDINHDDHSPPNRNEENPWYRKNLKWILVGMILLLVTILSAVVTVVSLGGGNDEGASRDLPQNRDKDNPQTIPIPDRAELVRAMDLYLSGNVESVETLYGPLEDWDVSYITDFSQLIDARGRNPAAASFNVDLSRWNVSAATSTFAMFRGARQFNQDLSTWAVHRVRDFSFMFSEADSFSSDLSMWKPSSAVTIESMFQGASSFVQDLCAWGWRLSATVNIQSAFRETACPDQSDPVHSVGPYCTTCPQPVCFSTTGELYEAVNLYLSDPSGESTARQYAHPIGNWCVGQVKVFDALFSVKRNALAVGFNHDISKWDLSGATSLYAMFDGAREFEQDLSRWNVSSVVNFDLMFSNCTRFNSDISQWDVSNAFSMASMFSGATGFDQPIGSWDVSGVYSFAAMFESAFRFNADLSKWQVGSGKDFDFMFFGAENFNANISSWDTSQAIFMAAMFAGAKRFSADLSGWAVERVIDMYYMFAFIPNFNCNLSTWQVGGVRDFDSMFYGCAAFDQDLCAWGELVSPNNTLVEEMFLYSGCPSGEDPDFSVSPPGPFCHPCLA